MSKRIMIIDAYNVIHLIPCFADMLDISLERARNALVHRCTLWKQNRRDITDFWIVFDGKSEFAGQSSESTVSGVLAIFTSTGQTADEKIIEIIEYGDYNGAQYTVVSNDNFVISNSKYLGAKVISVQQFQSEAFSINIGKSSGVLKETEKEISSRDAKDINDWLSHELGL
jgi:predicted RNA-binding protein with PIN domain